MNIHKNAGPRPLHREQMAVEVLGSRLTRPSSVGTEGGSDALEAYQSTKFVSFPQA